MCLSTAQAHTVWVPRAGASNDCALVLVPCAFSHMVVTFRGRRRGNLWCFGALKSTFRDRCSALDMIVEELRFRDRCSQ